jgi:two-component system cell cycle sensor histidine kinase/response regulator CckA
VVRRLLGDTLRLDVVAAAAPRVCVDPGQLEQVIINLALNARDAMPEGGTLTLTTGQTELPGGVAAADGAVIPAGPYATLLVRDNGVGMDAATQARIFEPFFTTKPVGQGTGLGLAAALGIVEQHHGYLTLASAPDQGAAFTMYLPIHTVVDLGEPGGESHPPVAEATKATTTVMVVDDESGVRTVVARSLEQGGYRVLKAHDGGHALELVARLGPPHLVITDLTMPGMGGAELARRLTERWPALPIIFMSGYSEAELVRQGAIGSGGELLQKPFSPAGLVACVTATLSRAGVPAPGPD